MFLRPRPGRVSFAPLTLAVLVVGCVLSSTMRAQADEASAWAALEGAVAEAAPAVLEPGAHKSRWLRLAEQAGAYRARFSESGHAREAEKLELAALLQAEAYEPEIPQETVHRAQAYVGKPSVPVRDRLEIKIVLEQARLRRVAATATAEEQAAAYVGHARELIAGFPDQPEGYGFMLSLAKLASGSAAEALAEEILSLPAPENYQEDARRVLRRVAMRGKPLALRGGDLAVGRAATGPWVLYTWTVRDEGFLEIIRELSHAHPARFVGINLDLEAAAARRMAAAMELPGPQIYDGGGFNGPVASQLNVVLAASVCLVDEEGIVRSVDGLEEVQRWFAGRAVERTPAP